MNYSDPRPGVAELLKELKGDFTALMPRKPALVKTLAADMEEHGYDPAFPIIRDKSTQRQVEGWHRSQAAARAGVAPVFEDRAFADAAEIIAFVGRANLLRRMLTPEERRPLVARLRKRGQTVRQIAEELGVPKSTVAADDKANRKAKGNGNGDQRVKVTPEQREQALKLLAEKTPQAEIAKRLGVSTKWVQGFKRAHLQAARGVAEMLATKEPTGLVALTDAQRGHVLALLLDGKTPNAIFKKTGVPVATVKAFAAEAETKDPDFGGTTPTLVPVLAEAVRAGADIRELAKRFGYTQKAIKAELARIEADTPEESRLPSAFAGPIATLVHAWSQYERALDALYGQLALVDDKGDECDYTLVNERGQVLVVDLEGGDVALTEKGLAKNGLRAVVKS